MNPNGASRDKREQETSCSLFYLSLEIEVLEQSLRSERLVGKSDFGASVRRLNSDLVIHGTLNPLFATEISFGCLNRNVTEQILPDTEIPHAHNSYCRR
jgi:hypothetical protein